MIPYRLLETVKTKAGQIAYGSFLYDWTLSETPPDHLATRPVDPWKGDPAKALALLTAAGVDADTGPRWSADWWQPADADTAWIDHMHGFTWLRDLRTLGGPLARAQGQAMIESWMERYPAWHSETWRADLTGQRVAMWITHYEFFCMNADDLFEDAFLTSLVKQAKHLHYALGNMQDITFFHSVKGLIYAGLAIEAHGKWVDYGLSALERALARQILEDGGHASRNPANLLQVLEVAVDIRSALRTGARKTPAFLDDSITKMSAALRFFRYPDRKLGVFHGALEGHATRIDSILAQCGLRARALQSLPYSGFERAELGRTVLLLDVGKSPESPFDALAHASPLAFELSYGKDRLFVSCGAHQTSAQWSEALRFTAAHNTASLDYRNACEIRKDGHFGRKVTNFNLHREETPQAILLEAAHNGYVPLNGITHTRRLYLGDEGHDIRGQDDFTCAAKLIKPVEIALRFHLHPKVAASLVGNDTEALLRMPGSVGWRFSFSAGTLKLEDSLYLGADGTPQKTKQLVVYGPMSGTTACIKWAVKREC